MQLKKTASIRLALAAASCALLVEPSVHAEETDAWVVNFGALFYEEKDRVSIIEPVLMATYSFNDEDYIRLSLANDTMSGASPTGASVSNNEQTIPVTTTSASGVAREGTKVPAKALPVNEFSDQRNAISVNWQKAYSRTLRSIIGANFSKEHDYSSLGSSISLQRDTADKLTTFSLGLSYASDTIDPYGGAPEPLSVLVNLGTIDPEDHANHSDDEHNALTHAESSTKQKQVVDAMFGMTQVVSRQMLAQLNYSVGVSNGYLTDPYKIVSVVNASTGLPFEYYYEKRPDTRLRQVIFLKSVFHLPTDIVHLSYRYYWDDWSIEAHTAEVKYRFKVDNHFYLMPNFRYYKQSGASFFKYSMLLGKQIPDYASADLRLAPLQSTTTGLKLGYNFRRNTEVSFRAEYMQQWGEDNPAKAAGVQTQIDLFPKLQVMMYTFEISYDF